MTFEAKKTDFKVKASLLASVCQGAFLPMRNRELIIHQPCHNSTRWYSFVIIYFFLLLIQKYFKTLEIKWVEKEAQKQLTNNQNKSMTRQFIKQTIKKEKKQAN